MQHAAVDTDMQLFLENFTWAAGGVNFNQGAPSACCDYRCSRQLCFWNTREKKRGRGVRPSVGEESVFWQSGIKQEVGDEKKEREKKKRPWVAETLTVVMWVESKALAL